MSTTLPGLSQAFEPVRQGLKRVLVEADDRGSRLTALNYFEATDQIIEMSAPGGTLEDAVRSVLVSNLQTKGVTVEQHVSSQEWLPALQVVYTVLALSGLSLAPPPGPPVTHTPPPTLPKPRPGPKPKPAQTPPKLKT